MSATLYLNNNPSGVKCPKLAGAVQEKRLFDVFL